MDSYTLLTEEQIKVVGQLFNYMKDVFVTDDMDLGRTTAAEHIIDTGSTHPIKMRPHRVPIAFRGEEEK